MPILFATYNKKDVFTYTFYYRFSCFFSRIPHPPAPSICKVPCQSVLIPFHILTSNECQMSKQLISGLLSINILSTVLIQFFLEIFQFFMYGWLVFFLKCRDLRSFLVDFPALRCYPFIIAGCYQRLGQLEPYDPGQSFSFFAVCYTKLPLIYMFLQIFF